jgi:uncharacterized membrane protein
MVITLIIPGIIKSLAYSQSTYIIYNNPKISVIDALIESERIMDVYKGEFFLLRITFIAWDLLVLITAGLAAFYVIPYKEMAYLEFYNNIMRPDGKESAG